MKIKPDTNSWLRLSQFQSLGKLVFSMSVFFYIQVRHVEFLFNWRSKSWHFESWVFILFYFTLEIIYIYIYILSLPSLFHPSVCLSVSQPIYIYIYIYIHREREIANDPVKFHLIPLTVYRLLILYVSV